MAGWVVLNVAGSAITNPGLVDFGGLLHKHEGKFLLGFSGLVSVSNILHAEIMNLLS